MSADDRTVIVGGGVAGLTLAYALAKAGKEVVVLERDAVIGGLARSYHDDGYLFDVGPHRFYTEEPEVTAFISEILGNDKLLIPRCSALYMSGRFIEWPLTMAAFGSIEPRLLLKVFFDMFRRGGRSVGSFEDYIVGRYGQTLYEIFFKPYTEKFLGISCSETAREWAIAGIDRATIDGRSDKQNLFALVGSMLHRREQLRFIYPASGGIGVFVDKLAAAIKAAGGEVQLNAGAVGLDVLNSAVTAVVTERDIYPCRQVVWTGSLHGLAACLNIVPPAVEYLSLLLFNYRLTAPCQVPYQWCYFGEAHIPFNRVSFPTRFNPDSAPMGCSGLCAEVTCRAGDALWNEPLAKEPAIRRALAEYGLIPSLETVSGVAVERVADAYPVYRTGYREQVDRFMQELPQINLTLSGRTGGFWYNNMDNSIAEALQLANRLELKEKSHE
jgi:protoporphyrinogen oxidase